MNKKSSYKSNSWWGAKMIKGRSSSPSCIEDAEDRKQNEILQELELKFQKSNNRKKK